MLLQLPQTANGSHLDGEATDGAHTDHGWMISYVDVLMLLLTLFVVLLAFETMEQPAPAEQLVAEVTDTVPAASPAPVAPESPLAVESAPPAQAPAATPVPNGFELIDLHSAGALLAVLESHVPAPPPAAAPATEAPREPAPAAAPALEIPASVRERVQVATTPDTVNLIIKDEVLFDRGSADIKPEAHRVLDDIAALLARNAYSVSIEGHTDDLPIQTARYPSNWDLSVARATQVTRYLIGRGIDRQRLRAVGYADTRPLDAAATAEARARNRRVSLVVHLRAPERAPEEHAASGH